MTKFGTMLEQRTICLVPIPFSDLIALKRRLVLIISPDSYNDNCNDILVMAITSNLLIKENAVHIEQNDMQSGVLKETSVVRIDKIYSISSELVIKNFGKINSETYLKIIDKLLQFIEIKRS